MPIAPQSDLEDDQHPVDQEGVGVGSDLRRDPGSQPHQSARQRCLALAAPDYDFKGRATRRAALFYTPPKSFFPGRTRSKLWMRQSCAVNLVRLDVHDRALGGFGAEGSKPVRGLVGGMHLLLILPQGHRKHLAALGVGEEQAATITSLHPKRRDDVLFDRTAPLF